jgi:hypothetical protein
LLPYRAIASIKKSLVNQGSLYLSNCCSACYNEGNIEIVKKE